MHIDVSYQFYFQALNIVASYTYILSILAHSYISVLCILYKCTSPASSQHNIFNNLTVAMQFLIIITVCKVYKLSFVILYIYLYTLLQHTVYYT